MVQDAELLDLVEEEIRDLLTKYRFPGQRHADYPRQRLKSFGRGHYRKWAKVPLEIIGRFGYLHSRPQARNRQAVLDADRRHLFH